MTLRDAIHNFAPSLIEYLDLKPREWIKVERKIAERNAIFEGELRKNGEPVPVRTTIYDLMVEAFFGSKWRLNPRPQDGALKSTPQGC